MKLFSNLKMVAVLDTLAKADNGVTAIEYALIAAGIAIAIVIVVGTLGNAISARFQSIVTAIQLDSEIYQVCRLIVRS